MFVSRCIVGDERVVLCKVMILFQTCFQLGSFYTAAVAVSQCSFKDVTRSVCSCLHGKVRTVINVSDLKKQKKTAQSTCGLTWFDEVCGRLFSLESGSERSLSNKFYCAKYLQFTVFLLIKGPIVCKVSSASDLIYKLGITDMSI